MGFLDSPCEVGVTMGVVFPSRQSYPQTMLSDIAVRNAKPRAKPYKLADEKGLFLLVNPNGGKWWRYKYRFFKKEKLLALGTFPEVSLKEARNKHAEARQRLAEGKDPGAHRKAEKVAAGAMAENTFGAWAEAWYKRMAKRWAKSTADKARAYLDSDILPGNAHRPIRDMRRADLLAIQRKIEERGAFDVAKKYRGWIQGIFRPALVAEVIDFNPATDLDAVAERGPRRRKHPHIPYRELPALLRAIEAYQGEWLTKLAINTLFLTMVRPVEMRLATPEEFDLDHALWSIPAERMKMRRPHLVPLSAQAVAVLRKVMEIRGDAPLMFPGRDDPSVPISENTVNKALAAMGYARLHTGHGTRHLMSTALNEQGFNKDWIERQLAHSDEDEVRDTYNEAEYLEGRRTMLQVWADQLDALRDGRKVVAGKFGRANT